MKGGTPRFNRNVRPSVQPGACAFDSAIPLGNGSRNTNAFPDENHWILTPQNSIYGTWEFQGWLARWIGGPPVL